jgi:hypothetical protein
LVPSPDFANQLKFDSEEIMSSGRNTQSGRFDARQVAQKQVLSTGGDSEDVTPVVTIAVLSAIVAAIVVGLLYLLTPFTHSANKVYVSAMNDVESGLAGAMTEQGKRELYQRIGVDFSTILAPADRAPTKLSRTVTEACLPSKAQTHVLPNKVHLAYQNATEYLLCAMSRHTGRLCHPDERQHLVAQLLQYKDRRQNVLGLERSREKLMSSPATQQAAESFQKLNPKGRSPGAAFPSIGNEIDERIGVAITALNRRGLLTASDFYWLGLFLPSEYAAFLTKSDAGTPAC